MGNPEIKDLFYKTRFVGGWQLVAIVLYSPIGLLLALLRVFISLQAFLLALLLLIPELSYIRKFVLRVMSLILGIFVLEENPSLRDKSVRVLIANHITVLDHLPIHLVTGCFSPGKWDLWPVCVKVFEGFQDKYTFAAALRAHVSSSSSPLLLLPEETNTNGRVGLLKFSPWCSSVAPSVQPVCLQVWRPFSIMPSTMAATAYNDLFWFLFCPITIFKIRYLPVIERQEGESDEDMANRVAETIARELRITTTKFTAKDKYDYEKRYLLELNRSSIVQPTQRVSYEMQRMASQVAEVLPYVPNEAILRDLSRTRSVDLTISNILEGVVRFTPLPPDQRPTTSAQSRTSASTSAASEASSSFPRSAQDRMMSFVERKTRLIEDARRRYMEKHGLTDKQ